MSHITGTVQVLASAETIGPDFGPATTPGTWALDFAHSPAPTGTQLVMLHFTGASLPANNRLEVDLAYGNGEMDVFTSSDGTDFWTRPINPYNLVNGKIAIRYISNGANTGGVQLDRYGRGERHEEDPNPDIKFDSYSNSDPFMDPAQQTYLEPQYAKFWFCNDPPNWENAAAVNPPGDIRNQVSPAVGMIVHADYNSELKAFVVSTCSVTLISPDTVITAGHCLQNPIEDSESGSIIFGYQTDKTGKRPNNYAPQVHKVKEVIRQRFADGTAHDYCILKLKTPVVGITPALVRLTIPAPGEQVFGIHHPNGAVKKLSIPSPGFASIASSVADRITVSLDVSGGSSGSGLFDSQGRIIGVLSNGAACSLGYYPTASIMLDISTPAPISRDVMLVFDRSGSMSLPGSSGQAKIHEAALAASLFVQLVRANAGNRVGLVSFSSSASNPVDFALQDVTAANKTTLIGPSPFNAGMIGALAAGGATCLGGGMNAAYAQLGLGSTSRHVLLLTDGLQNVPPMADPEDTSPAGVVVNAIGYGTPASLDGTLLTAMSANHKSPSGQHGQYVLADSNLKLQKFFSLAFGNIFEAGLLKDPEFTLPAGQHAATPMPFNVCEEETITVVVGWDHRDTPLRIELVTPMGAVLAEGSPGVDASSSPTWTFLRVALPQGGERNGTWQARVFRPGTRTGAATDAREVRYFVNVIANGGAILRRMPDRRTYYTGDSINPMVGLQYQSGGLPDNAELKLTVSRPDGSVGTLLSRERLGGAVTLDGDSIPPRQATLQAIEKRTGKSAVFYSMHDFPMLDDIATTGSPEPAGLFGNQLKDLLTVEGHYTFHVKASYGDGCTATRELMWSIDVNVGIDPDHSEISVGDTDGKTFITIIPRDRFGNHLGPGAADRVSISGADGTTLDGDIRDNGDGSYTVHGHWDPGATAGPGVVLGQPGRGAVVLGDGAPCAPVAPANDRFWKIAFWLLFALLLLLLLLCFWR